MPMTATEVQKLYVAYFNRPADFLGLEYWKTQSPTEAVRAFAAIPGITAEQAAYWEKVFRAAGETKDSTDFADKSFWTHDMVGTKDFQAFVDDSIKTQKVVMEELNLIKK